MTGNDDGLDAVRQAAAAAAEKAMRAFGDGMYSQLGPVVESIQEAAMKAAMEAAVDVTFEHAKKQKGTS